MCRTPGPNSSTANIDVFDPDTKCCTYVPTLPNFVVGMVLGDEDPSAVAGRATIQNRIAAATGVTPLGLQSSPTQALIYKHAGRDLFGRAGGMRCPHYLSTGGGQCGIWRHRNAVCATWFCKFERGQAGKRFWDALMRLLTIAERHLAFWAASELGESLGGLGPALLPYYATVTADSGSSWTPRWNGQAEEFYRASAKLVEHLSWTEVRAICGPELALLAGQLRAEYRALKSTAIPEHLRLGVVAIVAREDGRSAVAGYSRNDMPVMATSLVTALERFDGRRSTEDVCLQLDQELGLTLDKVTIRQLVDHEILVPVPLTPAARRAP